MKLIFSLILALAIPALSYSQSTVSGVVTYYFNEYQGDKPDLGSKVILIDSAKIQDFDAEVVEKFILAKSYRQLYATALGNHKYYESLVKKTKRNKRQQADYDKAKAALDASQKNLDDILTQLEKYSGDTDENFKALDDETTVMLRKIKVDSHSQKTIDASGNYSFSVTPGTYYVYITSNNRKGINLTEILGKIYFKKIKVLENESKDVSHNFDLY